MTDSRASQAFAALHRLLQKWVWRQGWNGLRPTQEQAIPILLKGDSDLIVAAATAGGKTEAAFLPILSRLLPDDGETQCQDIVLYISPLKALINDQFQRLELMTDGLGLTVVPWHGDAGQKSKREFLKSPNGVLLITPESFEAIFVNHGNRIPTLFERLKYIIVDELHAFIGVERGMQLQSLMHRKDRLRIEHHCWADDGVGRDDAWAVVGGGGVTSPSRPISSVLISIGTRRHSRSAFGYLRDNANGKEVRP